MVEVVQIVAQLDNIVGYQIEWVDLFKIASLSDSYKKDTKFVTLIWDE